jgi:hypothetical protein
MQPKKVGKTPVIMESRPRGGLLKRNNVAYNNKNREPCQYTDPH